MQKKQTGLGRSLQLFVLISFFLLCLPGLAAGQDCWDFSRSDLDCNGIINGTDVVRLKVFTGTLPPGDCNWINIPTLGDLNCDGFRDACDLVLLTICAFDSTAPLGDCPIPNVRPTVPDPLDSVIIESKTVTPAAGACASAKLRLKVHITNKDSVSSIALPFESRTVSGGAYGILSRAAGGCSRSIVPHFFDFLYPQGPGPTNRLASRIANLGIVNPGYHSDSPDSFLFGFTASNPNDPFEKMPPNPSRALLGEIKFDTIVGDCGEFEIDSSMMLHNVVQFVDHIGRRVPVNFVKGVVKVIWADGDVNGDGQLTSTDVVLQLNCAFLGAPGCLACHADLDCDGEITPTDVVGVLNAAFLGEPPLGCL